MQGKMIDMDKLISQNELTPAVGNAKVNARGDVLGAGGKIVKKREDIMAEYYETNPKARARVNKPVETKPAQVQEHIPGLDPEPAVPAKSTAKATPPASTTSEE
jgi:hypothetical protein